MGVHSLTEYCARYLKHIYRRITLTVNSFSLNRYSSLTVFISQNLSIEASSHRTSMILTYFETIFYVEFSQEYYFIFYSSNEKVVFSLSWGSVSISSVGSEILEAHLDRKLSRVSI